MWLLSMAEKNFSLIGALIAITLSIPAENSAKLRKPSLFTSNLLKASLNGSFASTRAAFNWLAIYSALSSESC